MAQTIRSREPRTRRFTRHEYERMAELGILRRDERVELLDGEIFVMSPQGPRHATVIRLLTKALERAFGRDYFVSPQFPLALSDLSEPEPDVAVIAGSPRDFEAHHPETAALLVEVTDSSQVRDRKHKVRAYAKARIPEYWIVDVQTAIVDVLRDPTRGRYRRVKSFSRRDRVRPLQARRAVALSSFLLPPQREIS